MAYPGWKMRDKLAPAMRFRLLTARGIVPYRAQAELFSFLDRKQLGADPTCARDDIPQPYEFPQLQAAIGGVEHWLIAVPRFTEIELKKQGEMTAEKVPLMDGDSPVIDYQYFPVAPSDRPRADAVAISASFKFGKSLVGGIVPASFGICPDLAWDIYGYTYDIAEPEFEYLLDCFLSEAGLNLPRVREHTGSELEGFIRWKNDPQMGRMYLELSNGARYTCRSMKTSLESQKSDPLKGKERDGFSIAEVYQFPSLNSLLNYRQNLAARRGYYVMPSTPDRPIVDEIIRRCNSDDPKYAGWQGVSEIHRRENPFAFRLEDFIEDCSTMSREEVAVNWEGRSGKWIGAVYPPTKFFDTETHPHFWHDSQGPPTLENFAPPTWMKRMGGADTGTLYALTSALADDEGNIFFLDSRSNYRYLPGGAVEQLREVTVESLCSQVRQFRARIGGKWPADIVDHNTQWTDEYRRNGIRFRSGRRDPEHRTEVTRGAAENGFLWFAPWMADNFLLYEFEIAKYPAGEEKRRRRIDKHDHMLDTAEHICAMHPRARRPEADLPVNPVRAILSGAKRRNPLALRGDPQMGA